MPYEKNLFMIAEEKNNLSGAYIYGDYAQEMTSLRGPDCLARFAPLSRKILYHYLKDEYDPLTVDLWREWSIRYLIGYMIAYKIDNKEPYDWEYIDHKFRKLVNLLFKTNLAFDQKIIDRVDNVQSAAASETPAE